MTFISDAKHAAARVQSISMGTAPQSSAISAKENSAVGSVSAPASGFQHRFPDLEVEITAEDRAFWCFMKPRERPSLAPYRCCAILHGYAIAD